jgi:cytochrome c oxidase subunit II
MTARARQLVAATAIALAALPGCGGEPGALEPRGGDASAVTALMWLMVALGTGVFALVLVTLVLAARGRRAGDDDRAMVRRSSLLVFGGGVALPVVILFPLIVVMLAVGNRIADRDADAEVDIEVIGHKFWWEVRYPDAGVVTANEIHIPAGVPIRLTLRTEDVIHSVWVPQLAGKIDMIPGETTQLVLDADEPGEYRGHCAEFCGLQHALMRFLVIAQEPDEFEGWLESQAEPAAEPATAAAQRGEEAFAEVGCAACHTVRGTDAEGDVGPDLTHLATRRTLGAATLRNDRGQLGGWITDPQAVKPGNLMPPAALTSDQLLDLIEYLEGLG